MSKKELISAYTFGERVGVSSTIIYRKIDSGDIEAEIIGGRKLIDWNKYKDIQFPHAKNYKKEPTDGEEEATTNPS